MRHHVVLLVGVLVLGGELHGEPEGAAAGDDGDLVQRVGAGGERRHQGMARLVVGGGPLLLVGEHQGLPLHPHQHLVLGELEVLHPDLLLVAPGGDQRRLVDQVGEVGAGEARRAAGDHRQLDVLGQRDGAGVDLEDAQPPADVRAVHHHPAVEAARAQQRRVEDVGAVGGGDQDDPFVGLEAVHLDEELVQGLLALVVAAAEAGAAVAADGVDLVDEDDAGGVLLPLLEEVAHPAGADADEHLDEVRAGDGEERHVRLAGDGPGQQRLAGARRAHQQHPLGDAAAQLLELLGLLEELDDLRQLLLGLLDPGDVLEGDLLARRRQQLGLALAEGQRLVAAGLHLAHEEDPQPEQQQHRPPGEEDGEQRVLLGALAVDHRPSPLPACR